MFRAFLCPLDRLALLADPLSQAVPERSPRSLYLPDAGGPLQRVTGQFCRPLFWDAWSKSCVGRETSRRPVCPVSLEWPGARSIPGCGGAGEWPGVLRLFGPTPARARLHALSGRSGRHDLSRRGLLCSLLRKNHKAATGRLRNLTHGLRRTLLVRYSPPHLLKLEGV